MGIADNDPAQQSFVSAFTQSLQQLGWQVGRSTRYLDRTQIRSSTRNNNLLVLLLTFAEVTA
jgi:hypothetical protein